MSIYAHISNVFTTFYVTNVWRCVCYVDASTSNRSQHVTPKGAGVHEMSVCVASGASRFGTDFGASFRCSKYVMFSITFGTPVRQNALCVTFGARRRPVPSQFLGAARACWATNAGQEIRYSAAPSGFTPTTSPESAPNHSTKPPQEHLQTPQVVSSVVGCAMHMKWPDGIGRGSWDWENPRQESANQIPALPVLTGHAIGCPRAGGSG